jgi:uncharacterized protein YndB with AHSA1/START domain
MSERSAATVMEPHDRVLVITRVFDAPRNLVFKAWTDPEHLANWFGPRGFTMTFCQMDPRAGGSYRFGMRSPEGTDHWLQGTYRELVEPEKLVCSYAWADAQGNRTRPETVLTITLADLGGKTQLTLHQAVFESVTACDAHRQGWTSSLERLAEYVAMARS